MSVFSFPHRLHLPKRARESSIVGDYASRGVRRHQKECGLASVRGCDFAFQQDSCEVAVLLFCLAFCMQSQVKQQRFHASVRKNYEICGSAIDLHRVECATASKKAHSQLRVHLFALATGAIIDAENRARDSEHYRSNSRGHTLSVITHSVKQTRPRLLFAARQPHRNERPSTRSALVVQRSSTRSARARPPQSYRAQAPTAMGT